MVMDQNSKDRLLWHKNADPALGLQVSEASLDNLPHALIDKHNDAVNELFSIIEKCIVFRVADQIVVEARADGMWVIKRMNEVWTRSGEWEWEPSPSGRSDEFKMRSRWSLEEALEIAENNKELLLSQ
jgi:hypothetical protein